MSKKTAKTTPKPAAKPTRKPVPTKGGDEDQGPDVHQGNEPEHAVTPATPRSTKAQQSAGGGSTPRDLHMDLTQRQEDALNLEDELHDGQDLERDPNNSATGQAGAGVNPAPRAGATSVNAPPRPAVSSIQRNLEQLRTAQSIRDRREGKVDSKTDESAGERRAARATVLAGVGTSKGRIKVMATEAGYYDHARRRPGDVFSIDATTLEEDEKDEKGKTLRKAGDVAAFSDKWMVRVNDKTREKVSSSNEHIREQHDEILGARHGRGQETVGDDDDYNPLDA